ncbi:MAG TPA: 4-vinyl reductase [Kouleothrix sp.]|uniref:4-vinyl reductase n=1 Tax=Kouleothrix sp. TaxID=2779161 RepID=UPI002C285467|nr:4-vinyl reductase [Kouleothrix sp.]HRC76138.1 4-vinyl reductase [Kouleothrix sp.]
MTDQQHIPSQVLRQVCESIIDNLGERSLRLLFAQAGLARFYAGGELPPADDTPSATVAELSHLFATAFRIFGDKGMKPILLRAGRNSLKHFRETNKGLAALAGAAFKVLPTDAKVKLVLSRSAKIAEDLLRTPHRTYDDAEGFYVEISACPYCAGSQATRPICYFPIGFYGEALRWATGESYPVEETECIASGGQLCRIRVGRSPA